MLVYYVLCIINNLNMGDFLSLLYLVGKRIMLMICGSDSIVRIDIEILLNITLKLVYYFNEFSTFN